jgi:hypothetical protein
MLHAGSCLPVLQDSLWNTSKKLPIHSSDTLVNNCQHTSCNILEEWTPQLHHGRSLKSCIGIRLSTHGNWHQVLLINRKWLCVSLHFHLLIDTDTVSKMSSSVWNTRQWPQLEYEWSLV